MKIEESGHVSCVTAETCCKEEAGRVETGGPITAANRDDVILLRASKDLDHSFSDFSADVLNGVCWLFVFNRDRGLHR